jgi:hypothetical protein
LIVHLLSFYPARINGYTNGSRADAQASSQQHWAIIERSTDYRNCIDGCPFPPLQTRVQLCKTV